MAQGVVADEPGLGALAWAATDAVNRRLEEVTGEHDARRAEQIVPGAPLSLPVAGAPGPGSAHRRRRDGRRPLRPLSVAGADIRRAMAGILRARDPRRRADDRQRAPQPPELSPRGRGTRRRRTPRDRSAHRPGGDSSCWWARARASASAACEGRPEPALLTPTLRCPSSTAITSSREKASSPRSRKGRTSAMTSAHAVGIAATRSTIAPRPSVGCQRGVGRHAVRLAERRVQHGQIRRGPRRIA